MIPDWGPASSSNSPAEHDLYWRFKQFLSDDFTVIHSLPWLSTLVAELDPRRRPTGELDFLILHPRLGILALEVKGGTLMLNRTIFVRKGSGERLDPVAQVRRSIHGLAQWITTAGGPRRKIGYGIVVPDSVVHGERLPISLIDPSITPAFDICIDRSDLNRIASRIEALMTYWQQATGNVQLSPSVISQIVDLICPIADYRVPWTLRLAHDTEHWLCLTPDQARCLRDLELHQRVVLEGRAGTGKTLLARTRAQDLAVQGKKVLFLVYNRALAAQLRKEMNHPRITITNFHKLCSRAAERLGRFFIQDNARDWFKSDGPKAFHEAIHAKKLGAFDALIVDEGQVFRKDWLADLMLWFRDKPILICCDETQVFAYEHDQRTTIREIATIFQVAEPYRLTINVRSPRAVFERLHQIAPPPYQHVSLRDHDDDTLIEHIVPNPLETLHTIIAQLQRDGVSSHHVVILYVGFEPPLLDPETFDFGATITSIDHYRGLEAPIVIIWSSADLDDTALACAYARATSRCIAIYHLTSFTPDTIRSSSRFREILLQHAPLVHHQLATFWEGHPFVSLVSQTAWVPWSLRWGGLVISPVGNPDLVASNLWGCYVQTNQQWPAFWVDVQHQALIINKPSDETNTIPPLMIEEFRWCAVCKQWAYYDTATKRCYDCTRSRTSDVPPPIDMKRELEHLDGLIERVSELTPEEKRQLPPALMALAYWRTLKREQQQILLPHLTRPYRSAEDDLVYIGMVLTGIDCIKLSPEATIRLRMLKTRYQTWSNTLLTLVADDRWQEIIGICTHAWLRLNLIKKADPNVAGVYQRVIA